MKWKEYLLPFGKWKGKTVFYVYVNDFSYLLWLRDTVFTDSLLMEAVKKAIEHKNNVDPWSQS